MGDFGSMHGDFSKGQENPQRSSNVSQTRCVSRQSCSMGRSSVAETTGDLLKTFMLEILFKDPNTSCEFLI